MDENDIRRVFAKAQKIANLLDATTSDLNEFAELLVKFLNDAQNILKENASLKAKIAELEAPKGNPRPAVEIAKAIDAEKKE